MRKHEEGTNVLGMEHGHTQVRIAYLPRLDLVIYQTFKRLSAPSTVRRLAIKDPYPNIARLSWAGSGLTLIQIRKVHDDVGKYVPGYVGTR